MNSRVLAAGVVVLSVLTRVPASAADEDATLLRVFLRDGASLVSYGEFARVADRVRVMGERRRVQYDRDAFVRRGTLQQAN